MVELGPLEGALVFNEDGDIEAYFPDQDIEAMLAPHLEKMALLLFISNDDELLKLARIKHVGQIENPN
jgi:hypothetical protein